MKNRLRIRLSFLIACCFLMFYGCNDYLGEKPDSKLVVPTKVEDLQATLDYYQRVNNLGPSSGESSADNYSLSDADWNGLTNEDDRRIYTWEKDFLFTSFPNAWSRLYDVVNIANTVLENLERIKKDTGNYEEWEDVKGQALFARAYAFLQIASIWCLGYDKVSASSDLGIPIRLDPDFNKPSVRSSLLETYGQILKDAKRAAFILPVKPIHVLRSSKPAAYGLIARVYLYMHDYPAAKLYADSCLNISNQLLDYNAIPASSNLPFDRFNDEVIFDYWIPMPPNLNVTRARIVPELYDSYDIHDLRKTLFFSNNNGFVGFKGSYVGSNNGLFGGIATDEIYLLRAECKARMGDINEAMHDLNLLMKSRWSNGVTFQPFTAENTQSALAIILLERRKELLYRGLRWMDIKRLNKEGDAILLTRNVNGTSYILRPNDLRYALPIPEDIIALANIQQNYR